VIQPLIAWFVRHPTAHHLLLAIVVLMGAIGVTRLNAQFFPTLGFDVVTIRMEWPGASAADVETNIVEAIEPEVRFLENVRRVSGFALEGVGVVVVEYKIGSRMPNAQSDIESAVARITTFPSDAEKAVIRRTSLDETISRIVVTGDQPESTLRRIARDLRDGLLARGIDKVQLYGLRDAEIRVEVPAATLRRLDLTLADVARTIGESSRDVPLGRLDGGVERQLRGLGQAQDADGVGAIVLRARSDGETLRIRDVAAATESYDRAQPAGRHRGRPAIELHVLRAPAADALVAAKRTKEFFDQARAALPPSVELIHYDIQADLIDDRLKTLIENGLQGLTLILICLFLFLNGWLALWVAVGLPAAMLATFAIMWMTGQTINMVSLFALIMAAGMMDDDAIVVAEEIDSRYARGEDPVAAAVGGAGRMFGPVLASSLTAVCAFIPIAMIRDILGQVLIAIPILVATMIGASLLECFLMLPAHLRAVLHRVRRPPAGWRRHVEAALDRFRRGPFAAAVAWAVRWRYVTIALSLAALLLTLGLVGGGRVGFVFFPAPEADVVYANFAFAPGTPRAKSEAMLAELDRALDAVEARHGNGRSLVVGRFGRLGETQGRQFETIVGEHLAGMMVELAPSDVRNLRTRVFMEEWRKEIRPLPGLERLTMLEREGGPPGRPIDLRLSGGAPDKLKAAAEEAKALLARYPGIGDVEDDLPEGRPDLSLTVTPRGRSLGFTTDSVARQVRGAFEGQIATRFTRGEDEIAIKAMYPRAAAGEAALRELRLRGPTGAEVALTEAVTISEAVGFARIRRQDGVREVSITANIDLALVKPDAILARLPGDGVIEIARRHGLDWRFAGKAEEQARTLEDLRLGVGIALVGIYIIVAWILGRLGRPFSVMLIIPFGLIGAVLGHKVMGYDLTILSLVALIGLSGIVVNNSIILVDFIDEHLDRGEPVFESLVASSVERFRAVLLSSITTIGGMAPLMFETSLQARFLIPMAITISFGLAVSMTLVVFVVPAMVAIEEDIKALWRRRSPAHA